ncbi:salivary glue protein Sgs-3-like [Patiria miniata]|uniref:Uncharacterized protein n=1 Tax=Patiria miniata TaxID=46514 RepID=A0A914AFT0_PATMI|nr:salivary glue protein Sgs-3-like [Patiria miniata]
MENISDDCMDIDEELLGNPYLGEPTTCSCKNTCQRGRLGTRGACPCKCAEQHCTDACTCGTKKRPCCNRNLDSESDTDSDVEDENLKRSRDGQPNTAPTHSVDDEIKVTISILSSTLCKLRISKPHTTTAKTSHLTTSSPPYAHPSITILRTRKPTSTQSATAQPATAQPTTAQPTTAQPSK